MKVAIIGAGNMGGAIARGLAQGHYVKASDIIVTNPSTPKLEKLKAEFPEIHTSSNNRDAADADVVIVAVKPWKVEEVLKTFASSSATDTGFGSGRTDIRGSGTFR